MFKIGIKQDQMVKERASLHHCSLFLFGSNGQIPNDQGLNLIKVNLSFHRGTFSRKVKHRWLRINHKANLSLFISSADIPWVYFLEVAFSIVKFSLGFSFHEILTIFGLANPFSIVVADPQAQVYHISVSDSLAIKVC